MEFRTPGYTVREETKREKLRLRATKRAWRYEEMLSRGEGRELARICWEEIRERERKEEGALSRWERERKEFREERGRREEGEGKGGRRIRRNREGRGEKTGEGKKREYVPVQI